MNRTFEPGADVYVINTCTVTNIADRKSRQMLHKAKKMNPDAVVVATGCYVQTDEGKLEKDEAVDLVLGNNQKKNIVEVLADFEREHQRQAHIIKINQTKEYEELEISHTAEHVRAYIKVQDGCNQFLHLLYHSLRKRPRAKAGKREYFKRKCTSWPKLATKKWCLQEFISVPMEWIFLRTKKKLCFLLFRQ